MAMFCMFIISPTERMGTAARSTSPYFQLASIARVRPKMSGAECLHRGAQGFSCGALHERGVRPKVGGERADRVLRIVEIRNLLAEDGAKQMHAKSRGESLADDGEHAALRAADDPGTTEMPMKMPAKTYPYCMM